jgi:hypothetical protein
MKRPKEKNIVRNRMDIFIELEQTKKYIESINKYIDYLENKITNGKDKKKQTRI